MVLQVSVRSTGRLAPFRYFFNRLKADQSLASHGRFPISRPSREPTARKITDKTSSEMNWPSLPDPPEPDIEHRITTSFGRAPDENVPGYKHDAQVSE